MKVCIFRIDHSESLGVVETGLLEFPNVLIRNPREFTDVPFD